MNCLGIESTAHTFGASVVTSDLDKPGINYANATCEIKSNEKDSYSTEKGGMIPRELAEHHYRVALPVIKQALEKAGLKVTGWHKQRKLPEVVELAGHPWFVGVQFHPEFQSRPTKPHPLFVAFIEAALKAREGK